MMSAIFFDDSTTVLQMAAHLPSKVPVTAITNSLTLMNALTGMHDVTLLALGGSGSYSFTTVQPLLTGMNLALGGAVSGTPGATGTVTSLISITDAGDSSKKLTPFLKTFQDHTQAYGLARDAHTAQAQQKQELRVGGELREQQPEAADRRRDTTERVSQP